MRAGRDVAKRLAGMAVPVERGLGVDLLLVLCWEDVDSVPSSTLPEQLSFSSSFIHLCIRITKE